MLQSSIGSHTFAFFQRLKSEEEYYMLENGFSSCSELKSYPVYDEHKFSSEFIGRDYTYKTCKGIRWSLRTARVNPRFVVRGVMVIINPSVLIGGSYITAATEDDIEKVEKLYNQEAAKISPILKPFGSSSMSRNDVCIHFDLDKLEIPCANSQMMKLIKRGDIPAHFNEYMEYDHISHRMKSFNTSFYLVSKSLRINCYLKLINAANANLDKVLDDLESCGALRRGDDKRTTQIRISKKEKRRFYAINLTHLK